MTKSQLNSLTQLAQIPAVAALIAGLAQPVKARKQRTYTKAVHVDDAQDYKLRRLTMVGRGFQRKGIKVTFDQSTGRFENVKPYRVWLSEGRQVRKGEKSVRGFFHVTQTDAIVTPAVIDTANLKVGDMVAA